jgi:hypothetical protein
VIAAIGEEPGTAVAELEKTDPERAALDLLLHGFKVSRMLRLVADLGVADRIAPDGRVALNELAAACGVHPQPLMRVLRALASFGVFGVAADGGIAHTPRSRLLRTDAPNSLHHTARLLTARGSWRAWEELDAAMTEGVPHEVAWGQGRFAYLREHQEEARLFDAMMANFPDNRHAAVAAAYDFSGARLICDVGGGNGAALRHILGHFPLPRGLVFDLDDVVRAIRPEELMGGRIEVEAGSAFDGVPPGADVYMLVRVLHDWNDGDCVRILRVCRAAMGLEARLLLGEQILEPDPARGRQATYLLDAQMMAMFGSARERTVDEFRSLLAEAGFALRRVVPTASPVSIFEAVPV